MGNYSMWITLFTIILLWFLWYVGNKLWTNSLLKKSATVLTSEDFESQSHGHDIVDIREPAKFKSKHVFGARNIQYVMLKENHAALRKDKPVFLYDENMQFAARMANILKKDGYDQVYVLKNGFADYKGKVKSNQ